VDGLPRRMVETPGFLGRAFSALGLVGVCYLGLRPRLGWNAPLALARQRQGRKQVPFEDDSKKGKGNNKCKGNGGVADSCVFCGGVGCDAPSNQSNARRANALLKHLALSPFICYKVSRR